MYYNEQDIQRLDRSLSELQSHLKLPGLDPDDKAAIREDISEVKKELKEAWDWRIVKWKDSFRKEPEYDRNEFVYEEFGHAFKSPTKAQIRGVLEVLDQDHPGWDSRGNEEPFFATLHENFPELKKASMPKARKSSKGGGCLVLVALLLFVAYLIAV